MEKTLIESKRDLFMVDIRNIDVIPDFNKREDYGNIEELADNILQNGLLNPLKCRRNPENKEKHFVIQGHRRLRACKYLLDKNLISEMRVPVVLEGRSISEMDRYIDMISGNEGKQLNILEQAEVINKLLKLGLEEEDIQKRLCKPALYVKNCQILLSAPASIKNKIKNNMIAPTLVFDIFRKEKNFDNAVKIITEMDSILGPHTGKKITKKAIDKNNNKINSISIFKKIYKNKNDFTFRKDKQELYDFIIDLINGKIGRKQICETFFEKESNEKN